MNDAQIRYFLTIVKYMNMSTAAKELFITQPALSLSISKMEKNLGLKLFERNGNKIRLTAPGEKLLSDFKSLHDDFNQLFSDAGHFSEQKQKELIIGFAVSAVMFASMFTNNFLDSYDSISIKKIYADRTQIITMLKTRQIDFAITYYPIDDTDISNQTIMYEPITLAVSSKHRLAALKSVSFEQIGITPMVSLTKSHYFRKVCDKICKENNFTPNYVKEFTDYSSLDKVIARYAGTDKLAVFCAANSFEETFGEGYCCIPLSAVNAYRATSISWLTERHLDLSYKGMIENLVRNFPKHYATHLKIIKSL